MTVLEKAERMYDWVNRFIRKPDRELAIIVLDRILAGNVIEGDMEYINGYLRQHGYGRK